eukprot:3248536-Amphidinium_carterae.2
MKLDLPTLDARCLQGMNLFTSQRSSPTHDIPESRQEQGYGAISPSRVESPARGNSLDYEVRAQAFAQEIQEPQIVPKCNRRATCAAAAQCQQD